MNKEWATKQKGECKMKRCYCVVVTATALVAGSTIVGCVYDKGAPDFEFGDEDLNRYIEYVRGIAIVPRPEDASDGWYMAIPDSDLHPFDGTSRECKRWYKLVYADRRYISFRCEECVHRSDRMGPWITVTVGSIDRATGKRVTLNDVESFADRELLKQRLRNAELKRGSGSPSSEERALPHDNFCLMDDGWHFVYETGVLDDLSTGPVELVIGK